MPAFLLAEGVYSVGVPDPDRRLFDELIPLPQGTSYNSYLIRGKEKTALIDAVYPPKFNGLISNLRRTGVSKIDYIICNHSEGDHAGSIPRLLELYPDAKVVTNKKCMEMLIDSLMIPEDKFLIVDDGGTLDLGGKTLEYLITPWVHWPDTMLTYLREDRILFTCDLFGSHLPWVDPRMSFKGGIEAAAKRYYAEIMMPFRPIVRKHLERIKKLEVKIIAPSHGPIHSLPSEIFGLYEEWTSDSVKNEVVVPYVSMYGNTLAMVERLEGALAERGIIVRPFNLTFTDMGELAMALVDAATVVFGTPTVLAGPHPSVLHAAALVSALRPKVRFISLLGSYGWGGKTVDVVRALTANLKAEFIEPVLVRGHPKPDERSIEGLAERIAERHREIGIG